VLNITRQRPQWEGDQEIGKRSGRDEPIKVVIHMCMEAMLGISVQLSQASKNTMSFLLSLMFSLQQNPRRRRQNRFCQEVGGGGEEVASLYTDVIKCKKNNILKKILSQNFLLNVCSLS
jgi:hypothetical protein